MLNCSLPSRSHSSQMWGCWLVSWEGVWLITERLSIPKTNRMKCSHSRRCLGSHLHQWRINPPHLTDLLLHWFPITHRSTAPGERWPAGLVALREAAAVWRPQWTAGEGLCFPHAVLRKSNTIMSLLNFYQIRAQCFLNLFCCPAISLSSWILYEKVPHTCFFILEEF